MRRSLLAALMAASILVPATASAQDDRPQRGERGGNGGRQRDPGEGGIRARDGGGFERQPRAERQAPPQVQVQAQPEVRVQAQPQVQVQARGGPGGGFNRGERENRGDVQGGRGDFRGNRGDFRGNQQQQVQIQQQQQLQAQQQQQARQGYRGNGTEAYRRDDRRGDGRNDGRNGGFANGRGNDGRGYDQRANNNGYNGGSYRGNDNRGGYNNNNRAWSRDWRRDNRYNYSFYRNQNRNAFHLPRYYAPYGWDYGYRRFTIGYTLSSILYNEDYWIDDADYYRLPPAYGSYRWVRYYNDALLVDLRTGYVVDTVYDIFW